MLPLHVHLGTLVKLSPSGLRDRQASQRRDFSPKPLSLRTTYRNAAGCSHDTMLDELRLLRGLFSPTISGMNGPITLLYFSDEDTSREKERNRRCQIACAKSRNADIAELNMESSIGDLFGCPSKSVRHLKCRD